MVSCCFLGYYCLVFGADEQVLHKAVAWMVDSRDLRGREVCREVFQAY